MYSIIQNQNFTISRGHQTHWLLFSDLMYARCLLWSWLPAGRPFRRHPVYICVLLSEWDVWGDASSVPLSWQPAYLLQPVWVQLCIDHLKCDSTAFFFSPLCTGTGRSCRASARCFFETKCNCVVGLWWHCFLPISEFNCSWSRLWRLFPATNFLF